MDLICPQCHGSLVSRDGVSATCTTHGGRFKILFTRHPFPSLVLPPVAPPPVLAADATCVRHTGVPAAFICSGCGRSICTACDVTQPDGSHRCPDCAQQAGTVPPMLPPPVPSFPAGVRCVQHRNVNAAAQCKLCGGFMCHTCTFDLPGGIKICPACAVNPRITISPRRQKMLFASFALALWSTLMQSAVSAGFFRNMVHDRSDLQLLGLMLIAFLVVPSAIGLSLGLGCLDRRYTITPAMWVATIWNGLILGGFLLLRIVQVIAAM